MMFIRFLNEWKDWAYLRSCFSCDSGSVGGNTSPLRSTDKTEPGTRWTHDRDSWQAWAGAGSCRTQVHGDHPFSTEGCVMAGTHVPTLLPAGQSSCVSLPQCRGSRHGWPEPAWCWFFIGCEHQQDGIPLHGGPAA